MASKEHSFGQERPASDSSGSGSCAARDKEPLDPELVDQLRAYLEHVVREAEKPPVYLAKHLVTDLYIKPDVYRHSSGRWG